MEVIMDNHRVDMVEGQIYQIINRRETIRKIITIIKKEENQSQSLNK